MTGQVIGYLADHEIRMLGEGTSLEEFYQQLSTNHEKLSAFIGTSGYTELPQEDRELLVAQESAMDRALAGLASYRLALHARIRRFGAGGES